MTTDATAGADPAKVLRSPEYLRLLVLAALIGLPISVIAYGFLTLVHLVQGWLFEDLPRGLGFGGVPAWWPLPILAVGGLLVGLAIRYLPGNGGHIPAYGLHTSAPLVRDLPGIVAAALAGLGFGVVLGPEAPLIALGGGLGVLALGRSAASRNPQAVKLVAGVGSFAAVATLLGSPVVGAFLLMEALGIAGALMGVVLVPGLLAAGVGSLIFVGLGAWTGLGTLSLTIPDLPPVGSPTLPQFLWAVGIGAAGAVVGAGIRRVGLWVVPVAREHPVLTASAVGVATGAVAVLFARWTGHSTSDILYSGQDELGPLITGHAGYSVGTLLLILVGKGIAYGLALGGLRGGPVFPSMFIGAAGGIALSHLPGLPVVAGAAMGIVALCGTMLRLPFTAVLLTALFLGTDGIRLMPLIIVSAVVAYIVSARLPQPSQSS